MKLSVSRVGVGLVSYNIKELYLQNLSNSLIGFDFTYKVVVDNSPTDKDKVLFEKLGWVYIHNPSNPGFGASHNLIFDRFSDNVDYHLIVNPDVIFDSEILYELAIFMDNQLDAGCVMPKVYYPDGRTQILAKLLPGPFDLLARRLPILGYFFNARRIELMNIDAPPMIFKVPFLSGCFLLFRVEVLKKIGFFDERFFMYMEDLDMSRRLWEISNYPYYYGRVNVTHVYTKGSARKLNLFIKHIVSSIKYFSKWGWRDSRRRLINVKCLEQFE